MSRKQQRLVIWMNGIKVGYWEKSKGVDSLEGTVANSRW